MPHSVVVNRWNDVVGKIPHDHQTTVLVCVSTGKHVSWHAHISCLPEHIVTSITSPNMFKNKLDRHLWENWGLE